MSGICGIVNFDDAPQPSGLFDGLNAASRRRGPDGFRARHLGDASFGFHKMAVNALDRADQQPVHDMNASLLVVADIRLDNRRDVGHALGLAPGQLAQTPDSGLASLAFARWGDACVDHLIGDYAIAVWDDRKRSLTLICDPMGMRPLYYSRGSGWFAFSSDIGSLLTLPMVSGDLDETMIAAYVVLEQGKYRPEMTFYKDVRRVVSGTLLLADQDGVRSRSFWDPARAPDVRLANDGEYAEALWEHIQRAVGDRLRTDGPVGLWLSGGHDSGAVAAAAVPILRARGDKLYGISGVHADPAKQDPHDARPWVDALERYFEGSLAVRHVADFAPEVGFPDRDLTSARLHRPSVVTSYRSRQLMSETSNLGVKVLMTGNGGDQILDRNGWPIFPDLLRRGDVRRLWREVRDYTELAGSSPWRGLVSLALVPLLPDPVYHALARYRGNIPSNKDKYNLLRDAPASGLGRAVNGRLIRRPVGLRATMNFVIDFMRQSLAMQSFVDDGIRQGFKAVHPMLDVRLVTFCLGLPEDQSLRNGVPRFVLRNALRGRLPDGNVNRLHEQDDLISEVEDKLAHEAVVALPRVKALMDIEALSSVVNLDEIKKRLERGQFGAAESRAFLTAEFIRWRRGDNV